MSVAVHEVRRRGVGLRLGVAGLAQGTDGHGAVAEGWFLEGELGHGGGPEAGVAEGAAEERSGEEGPFVKVEAFVGGGEVDGVECRFGEEGGGLGLGECRRLRGARRRDRGWLFGGGFGEDCWCFGAC